MQGLPHPTPLPADARARVVPRPGGRRPARAPTGAAACTCPVCGADRVRTDEVADRELVRLAACLRCDHRWTERLTPAAAVAAAGAPAPRRAASVERTAASEVRPAA